MGVVIDNIGVKTSLVLGSIASFICRMVLATASSPWTVAAILLGPLPLASALTWPVLKLGIRRYVVCTHTSSAFELSYVVINIASIVAALCLTGSRAVYVGGALHLSTIFASYNRVVLCIAAVISLLQIAVALCLRDVSVGLDSEIHQTDIR